MFCSTLRIRSRLLASRSENSCAVTVENGSRRSREILQAAPALCLLQGLALAFHQINVAPDREQPSADDVVRFALLPQGLEEASLRGGELNGGSHQRRYGLPVSAILDHREAHPGDTRGALNGGRHCEACNWYCTLESDCGPGTEVGDLFLRAI